MAKPIVKTTAAEKKTAAEEKKTADAQVSKGDRVRATLAGETGEVIGKSLFNEEDGQVIVALEAPAGQLRKLVLLPSESLEIIDDEPKPA